MSGTHESRVSARVIGRVTSFTTAKGYGFVAQEGGEELFADEKMNQGDDSYILAIGDRVRYDVVEGPEGPCVAWAHAF